MPRIPARQKREQLRLAAYIGLRNRDLLPLLDYLHAVEAKDAFAPGTGSPLVREFSKLIQGGADESDYRLQFEPHPDSGRGRRSRGFRQAQQAIETKTAIIMARNGAFKPGQFEAAVASTRDVTKLSRATIARHWAKRKAQVAYLLKVGLL